LRLADHLMCIIIVWQQIDKICGQKITFWWSRIDTKLALPYIRTFPRLHLLRLWTPTIFIINFLIQSFRAYQSVAVKTTQRKHQCKNLTSKLRNRDQEGLYKGIANKSFEVIYKYIFKIIYIVFQFSTNILCRGHKKPQTVECRASKSCIIHNYMFYVILKLSG
jgi:hypothetical protein